MRRVVLQMSVSLDGIVAAPIDLQLVRSQPFATGAVLLVYARAVSR